MRTRIRTVLAAGSLAAVLVAAAGCEGDDGSEVAAGGEIVITCEPCALTPTAGDTFGRYRKELTAAFNQKYKGRYRVESKPYVHTNLDAESAAHYQRQAATDTLPDLFIEASPTVQALARTGKLFDFADALERDPAWRETFKPDVFTSLTDADGHVWGVPEQVDTVGIFYNKKLFQKAGITAFPTTWDELTTAAARLESAGVIPFAMDGDWVTQLWWANLIGTTPGGADFLKEGIKNGEYAGNPTVVQATEQLKSLHTDGFVNSDAFTGDYDRAAQPFLGGQAAMIANGPWMIPDIEGAKVDAGYAASPGDGLIVFSGAGWASGAKDDASREAVVEFNRFRTSQEQVFRKAVVTGGYWPTTFEPTAAQLKQLEPLAVRLVQQASQVTYTYPHAKFAAPLAFHTAWINQWPAYVQGKLSTEDFLGKLSDAVRRQR